MDAGSNFFETVLTAEQIDQPERYGDIDCLVGDKCRAAACDEVTR